MRLPGVFSTILQVLWLCLVKSFYLVGVEESVSIQLSKWLPYIPGLITVSFQIQIFPSAWLFSSPVISSKGLESTVVKTWGSRVRQNWLDPRLSSDLSLSPRNQPGQGQPCLGLHANYFSSSSCSLLSIQIWSETPGRGYSWPHCPLCWTSSPCQFLSDLVLFYSLQADFIQILLWTASVLGSEISCWLWGFGAHVPATGSTVRAGDHTPSSHLNVFGVVVWTLISKKFYHLCSKRSKNKNNKAPGQIFSSIFPTWTSLEVHT